MGLTDLKGVEVNIESFGFRPFQDTESPSAKGRDIGHLPAGIHLKEALPQGFDPKTR